MTKDGTAQAKPPTTPPHEQDDGRVLISTNELCAAIDAMRKLADEKFLGTYLGCRTTGDMTNQEKERFLSDGGVSNLLEAALRAINLERLGDPEGTICVHNETGQMARRYWSETNHALRWLVVDPATDENVEIDGVEDLQAINDRPWSRVLRQDWPIHLGTERFRQGPKE